MLRENDALEQVTLTYRKVGETHVFTARELPGLHIGSSSLYKAFEQSIKALGEHVTRLSGKEACYEAEMTFADFKKYLAGENAVMGSFVIAKKSLPHAQAA